jgi:molybdenum cofactor cytidylyltransferase
MRLVTLQPETDEASVPARAVVSHDVRDPQRRNDVLAHKGSELAAAEVLTLLRRARTPLHLAVPETGDLAEDEAAERLAAAVAGAGVSFGQSRFGQVTLTGDRRGLLRVDAAGLERVNDQDGVLLMTADTDRPVESGASLAVIKCAPLFLSKCALEAVEANRATAGAVLTVEPFRVQRVAFVAPTERLRGRAFEQATTSLSAALAWYGSSLEPIVGVEATVDGVADGYRRSIADSADMILAAGAAATDPADVVFEGLRAAGGSVTQIGIPAEPGTACWIGELDGRPVLGLASCELFGRPGALDLLLPRLFVGEALDRSLLRRIAGGGLLSGPSRVAPYHASTDSGDAG